MDTTRTDYRELNDGEKFCVRAIKTSGEHFLSTLGAMTGNPNGAREFALAKTKIEEAVMWAVKGITG